MEVGFSDTSLYNSNHLKGIRPELDRVNLVLYNLKGS